MSFGRSTVVSVSFVASSVLAIVAVGVTVVAFTGTGTEKSIVLRAGGVGSGT